ncbi:MAG: hypothetical protein H7145_10455 [Akkermansiaceae bacterium]|nr:hypothetical protein [Armatimonadota bacterium]
MAEKRELIKPNESDKRYVRRDEDGKFTEDQVDVGRSLAADNNQKAKNTAKPGHGDQRGRKTKNKSGMSVDRVGLAPFP